jgi:hypothetical protein
MDKFIYGLLFSFPIFMLLESIIINYIYLSNIDLFNDLILTEKNRKKIRSYYEKNN